MRFGKDVFALVLLGIASVGFAADVTIPLEPNSTNIDLSDSNAVPFPYTAEITGTDIYMRSGPGMNYYRCGKLSVPDKVEVVAYQNGWSKIVPPAGSFSWISKEYVKLDSNDPGTGIITSDDVRVWAGSEYVEPMHSTSLQTKLSKGTKVYLFGEEKGDYYKITPPKDAYLWVNTQYTRFAGQGPMESKKPVAEANAQKLVDANAPKTAEANEPNAVKPAPKKINIEVEKLKEYRQLAKEVDVEKAKPIEQQNWTTLKAALTAIAENEKAGKAAKYSKAQLDRIESFELAAQAGKALQQQQQQLEQARQQIEKKRQEELSKIPNVGKFVVIGTLRASAVYAADAKKPRYTVVDDSGKIIAYAMAEESAASLDVSKFLNRKVGLVGTIERDQQSGSSLVRFTEIVEQ